MGNKPNLYKAITVTISNQGNLDEAAVKAVLAKLGLRTEAQLQQFSAANRYGSIVAYCLRYIHLGNNYTKIAKAARIAGQVVVTINVAVEIVNEIRTFLGQAMEAAKNHIADAVRQVGTGYTEAGSGIVKNTAEGLQNLDRGGGRALHGVWNASTATFGSPRYDEGLEDISDGFGEFSKGIDKIYIQTPADAALTIGLRIVSGWQTLLGLESVGREPTYAEKQILTAVFASSVELSAIRIKQGYAGILNAGANNGYTLYNNQRAITIGNTIYMKNNIPASSQWNSILVHETTHVWQNQNGGTDYMLEALHAQSPLGDGYGYADDIFNKKKSWAMLNPEQQGQLIQDAYGAGFFTVNSGRWLQTVQGSSQKISRPDLAIYMQGVLPQLRAGQGAT